MSRTTSLVAAPAPYPIATAYWARTATLLVALGLFALPTLLFVARSAWATEQGAHGPLVVGIGLWLLWRQMPLALAHAKRPGHAPVTGLFALVLPAFVVARIGGIVELEGYLMYMGLVTLLFAVIGAPGLRQLWFPLVFLALAFPPPESLVALATQPMKIAVSRGTAGLLALAGYPVGGEGVHIYIGQYELLVAEACSGLNAVVALVALAMLYVYLRRRAGPGYVLLFAVLAGPVAVLANGLRVLTLILLTYHAGEAAAQGFLHLFAGLTTFTAALALLIAADRLLHPLYASATQAGRGWPGWRR